MVKKVKVIFLTLVFCTLNFTVFSQGITLKNSNITVKQAIEIIKEKTGYSFVFEAGDVDTKKIVSLNVNNKGIEDVVKQVIAGQPLQFEIKSKNIILSKRVVTEIKSQSKKITGLVTDEKGEPIIGASVVLKGSNTGTITSTDGLFSLEVPLQSQIIISYIGFKQLILNTGKADSYKIYLEEDSKALNEVIVVGYGTQKKGNLTGSISSVKAKELVVAPLASTTNALAGRLPGLIAVQSTGQPGADAASLSIRGFGNALVIVDGVEANFNAIDANQIESVSILKDGAAAIYGSRAGNGVILVTTKRGDNKKPTISYNTTYTLQGITRIPTPCNAGQYAELTSEQYLNSGQNPASVPFTPEQIQKYYDGTDPLYPNTNWYNVLVRDWAPQNQHNLSVRGGSDKIKYYGFLGFLNQESMWKKNGGDYSRYNLQSNIDAKITDDLSLQLDLASVFENRRSTWRPQNGGDAVWQDFWVTLPIYHSTLPDPTKIPYADGAGTGGAHVTTNRDISGYNDNLNQEFRGTVSLTYQFKTLKGLSLKVFGNLIQGYSQSKFFSKPVDFYIYDPSSEIYTLKGSLGTKAALGQGTSKTSISTGQISINYDKVFLKNHHITTMIIYELIDYHSESMGASRQNFLTPSIEELFGGSTTGMSNYGFSSEMGRKSWVSRLNYSFNDRYLLEATLRSDASSKFYGDKQWGYSPGVSLGWRINQEPFMKNFDKIDNLKLRTSIGQSADDRNANAFQYLTGYKLANTYVFDGNPQQGISSTGLVNPFFTWESITISNVGLDFSFWKRKLYGETDIFYRTRSGIPMTRITTVPSSFGASLPQENIASQDTRGFEFMLGTSGELNDFSWDINGNISWSRTKWTKFEEPEYTDPDQIRIEQKTGNWIDRSFGYVSDGLFTSQTEIDQLKFDQDLQSNKSLRPGDVRFVDINQDGVLNWKDQTIIGKGTTPHWILGFNTNLKYKNFDLSALFQGAFGYNTNVRLPWGPLAPVQTYELRWTPENNNPNALVPRIGGNGGNYRISDYFYKDAAYIRLKALQLGYNLPKSITSMAGFTQCRIYLAGTNLLTFDKLSAYGIDPEAPTGAGGMYYPQQRTITLGFNISM